MEWDIVVHSILADRFRIDRHSIKEIFVDETLPKTDGQEYWLWLAYGHNLDVCLIMHLSRKRTFLYVASFSNNNYAVEMVEAHSNEWCKTVQWSLQMVKVAASGKWYRIEEHEGEVHPTNKWQNRIFWGYFPCRGRKIAAGSICMGLVAEIVCNVHTDIGK